MLRTAHGSAAQAGRTVVVEGAPADELPAGESRDARLALPPDASTRLARGEGAEVARAMQRRSAAAQAAKRASSLRILTGFGLTPESVPPALAPHLEHAREWCDAEVARVAREVGGGVASPAVAALIQSAALAMAMQRHAVADGRAGDAARFGGEIRANVLAAHELAAREAKARAASAPVEPW
jgi:hypothetical protein